MGRRVRLLAGNAPRAIAGVLFTALVMTAAAAGANRTPLELGKVTARVPGNSESLQSAFRSAVEHELSSIDLSRIKPTDRYVLSLSLVRMETSADRERARATCVVSATLTRRRGGALHAIINGRARAEDTPAEVRSLELSAMRAAVRSAMIRVPEALR